MSNNKIIVGYWNCRGLVQPIILLLEYLKLPYELRNPSMELVGPPPTVQRTPVSTKPFLCTKWPNLTLLFYYIKVPAHSHPQHPTLLFTWALK